MISSSHHNDKLNEINTVIKILKIEVPQSVPYYQKKKITFHCSYSSFLLVFAESPELMFVEIMDALFSSFQIEYRNGGFKLERYEFEYKNTTYKLSHFTLSIPWFSYILMWR